MMHRFWTLPIVAAILSVMFAADALSQVYCYGNSKLYAEATNILKELYEEERIGRGVATTGTMAAEVWLNEDTATWTVIRIMPNGCTVVMASGIDWHVPLVELGDDGA